MGNVIANGAFNGDLANWDLSGAAAYVANKGGQELGAVHLPSAGAAIAQSFSISVGREYMIDVWALAVTGSGNIDLLIKNSSNETIYTASLAVADTAWANVMGIRVGLPQGNHTLTVSFDDVAAYIDDVSIAWVIKTRQELADDAAELLGQLATEDAGFTADGDEQGDYGKAVDAALRAIGAVDDAGRPDVRYLTDDTVDAAVDEVQRYMLHKLHRYYARNATDFTLEGRTEHLRQRTAAIENLLGIAVGGRPSSSGRGVQMRRLIHPRRLS